ncbi:type IV inositol polyphosphate 5-phosphatase 9-like [Aristolochia californica]|uniref:type IV inositol polyphosphate 5-phosphatase 9-like n=1 Tax=Aristolochia californica TaxID=171875 RepID=UPI0035E11501
MWPKLIANKLLRKRMGSDRFVADLQKTEASNEVQSSSNSLFSETATSDQKETQKYKLFVSTWNVGGVAPSDDLNLEEWLDTDNNPCDIYALGFQEMVPLSAGNVLGSENSKIAMKWNSLIRAALNKTRKNWKKNLESKAGEKQKVYPVKDGDSKIVVPQDFKCIISKQMVGIFITVWVRGDLQRFVRHPSVSCVGCGIMGCLGNKGSVSIRFCLHETSFCFVCSHMASGGKIGDEIHRNSDAAGILARTSFPRGPSLDLPRKILDHDRVIWLGDLNYRISIPAATTRSLVERSEWDILLENDQLRVELSEGRVFEGWHEGSIKFAPTYKYYPNSDNYYGCAQPKKGEKRRSPAWCDRILWYGKGLKQKEYSRGESGLSDHRPVRAVFNVEVEELRNSHPFQNFFLPDRFDRIVDHLELFSGQQFNCVFLPGADTEMLLVFPSFVLNKKKLKKKRENKNEEENLNTEHADFD